MRALSVFSGRRIRAGLLVAAVVAGSTAAAVGAASADVVTPPTLTGCPTGTTVILWNGDATSPFGAYSYTWIDNFETTHGDGSTYHVTRGLDGQDQDLGDWSYYC
ncbi:MAG TPA: hypothetical protein VFN97_13205 [Actinospica sp.]|nr:hypothetical protein [Actinospica sp.]